MKISLLLGGLALAPLMAYGAPSSPSSDSAVIPRATVKTFNLARFVRENPKTAALQKYVGEGDAYLFFGEKSKYRVETNLTVDSKGGGILSGADRYVKADYFLDGYVFNQKLSQARLLDMGAHADLGSMKLEGFVRVMGEDKFKGEIAAAYEQSFVRDLPFEYVVYGVPMLGVKVKGLIGGELGLRAAPHLSADSAIGVNFTPKIALNGTVAAGVDAMGFLSAEAKGIVTLIDTMMTASASIAFLPDTAFSYGKVGLDSGKLRAIDGRIELYAKAGLNLPEGVNSGFWKFLGPIIGGKEWKHTLWDPEALYTKDLPSYGKSFGAFVKAPTLENCETEQQAVLVSLDGRLSSLEAAKAEATGLDVASLESAILNLGDVKQKLGLYCTTLAAQKTAAEAEPAMVLKSYSDEPSEKTKKAIAWLTSGS